MLAATPAANGRVKEPCAYCMPVENNHYPDITCRAIANSWQEDQDGCEAQRAMAEQRDENVTSAEHQRTEISVPIAQAALNQTSNRAVRLVISAPFPAHREQRQWLLTGRSHSAAGLPGAAERYSLP